MASKDMAQEVLICDTCNISPVQKYCKRCATNLCDGCIAKHISSIPSKPHEIVIYELKMEDPVFPDCEYHAKQQCEMHCKECDSPVCVICATSSAHRNHTFTYMLDIFKTEKDAIDKDTKELETSVYPTIEKAIFELQTKISDLQKHHEKLMTSISSQGEEWHRQIDVIINKRKKEVEKMKTENMSTLQKILSDMKSLLSAINQTILDNKELLKSNKITEIKTFKSKIADFKETQTKFDITPPNFTPESIPVEKLEKMFGILKSTSVSPQDFKMTSLAESFPSKQQSIGSPYVRSYIDTGYEELRDIACHSPDDIWVRGKNEYVKCFNDMGLLKQIVTTTTGKNPAGITVTPQGDLVCSNYIPESINIFRDETTETSIIPQGWMPKKMCFTASGDLLVSMWKARKTPKKVVRYRGSTEQQSVQFDQDGKPWFSTGRGALFIDENKNGDFCVSDCPRKLVLALRQSGNLRFTYNGNLSFNKFKSFHPYGIATDSECQILVADRQNHVIHIISEDGHFLRYIDNCKLSLPFDLIVDKNNTLYVTEQKTGKVKIIEYMK